MDEVKIMQELKKIREDLDFIKQNMVEKDMILFQNDLSSLKETALEKKEGKLSSLEEVENELVL